MIYHYSPVIDLECTKIYTCRTQILHFGLKITQDICTFCKYRNLIKALVFVFCESVGYCAGLLLYILLPWWIIGNEVPQFYSYLLRLQNVWEMRFRLNLFKENKKILVYKERGKIFIPDDPSGN